jgi:hypothetical protein
VAAVPKQFFDFGLRLREFVLPNDQFSRELRGLDRPQFFQDVERHPGHSN